MRTDAISAETTHLLPPCVRPRTTGLSKDPTGWVSLGSVSIDQNVTENQSLPESRVGCERRRHEMLGQEMMHISILDPRQLPYTQTDLHLIRNILYMYVQQ